jgi:hypothetical protein
MNFAGFKTKRLAAVGEGEPHASWRKSRKGYPSSHELKKIGEKDRSGLRRIVDLAKGK